MNKYINAGKLMKVNSEYFLAQDYWKNVNPNEDLKSSNLYVCREYANRVKGTNIPNDNKVVYGKIEGLGYLFHETELNSI